MGNDPIDKPTIRFILEHVKKFDAAVIIEGDSKDEESRLINKYAEGTVRGYKDAVKQIADFLEDLLQ